MIDVSRDFLKRRNAPKLIAHALRIHHKRHRPPYVPFDPQEIDDQTAQLLREQLIQFKKEFPEIDLLQKTEPDDATLELDQVYSPFIQKLYDEEK